MEINNASLIKLFNTLIKDFQASHDSEIIDFDLQVIQNKGRVYENVTDRYDEIRGALTECIAKAILCFNGFEMSFELSTRDCSLDFSVIFDLDTEKAAYSLFELANVLEGNDLRRYNNKLLFDENKLKIAFEWLVSGIDKHLSGIKEIAVNNEKIGELTANYIADVSIMKKRSFRENNRINSCYYLFCKNDYNSAIKKYEEYSTRLTVFELRVFYFMKSQIEKGKEKEFLAVPEEIDSLKTAISMNKKSGFELLAFYISFPIGIIIGSLPFIAVYFLYYLFVDYVYIIKPPILMPIIPGIFAGIFSILIIRKPILKLFLRKKYNDYMKYQKMKSGKADTYILSVLGGIIGVACIIFMVLCLRWNVIFKENGIINNSKFLFPTSEHISYDDVEALYETKAFLNSYGNVYPNPAYAIKLSDGRVIDLRAVGDPSESAISFLKSKGIPFREIEFVQDIK